MSAQSLGFAPPFSSGGAAMRLGVRAVEQNLGRRAAAGGKGMEDVQPNTLGRRIPPVWAACRSL
jgi:hypothetical protein